MDWDINGVVAQLRDQRTASARMRGSDRPRGKLPSPKALESLLDELIGALFPNRLGNLELSEDSVDYFVGNALDRTLRELCGQIRRELAFRAESAGHADAHERAVSITRTFASRLPEVRRLLDSDIQAAYVGDPAARSVDEVLVCYPGVMAMTHHRLAHELHRMGAPLVARIVAELAHSATGIDIHPGAQIGGSFFIDHGTGVVIGESCEIGQRVRVYQAVTLGAKRFETNESGELVKGAPRHPIVEDDVVIYAGATILGRITIGRGSIVGGNVWVTRSVPPGTHVTQAQARTAAFDDGAGI